MSVDMKKLRELAQAQMPNESRGKWYARETYVYQSSDPRDRRQVCRVPTVSRPHEVDPTAAFIAAANPQTVIALLDEIEQLRKAARRIDRYPLAPDVCPVCKWTNVHLMNYGTANESRWMCHSCAADSTEQLAAMKTIGQQVYDTICALMLLPNLDRSLWASLCNVHTQLAVMLGRANPDLKAGA